MSATVQLIAYADRFGSDLAGLESLLQGPLDGLFGGVHILPFFSPIDGADAGFDPDDHTAVDPRLGTWGDIASISSRVEVMADLIVNHVSARSHQAVDWQEHGDESPYKSMFLTMDGVFGPHPSDDELGAIYRPRPGVPFTTMAIGEESRSVWTTFSSEQFDLNVADAVTRAYLCSVLDAMAGAGVASVRLDAVGYAVKTPGTSCFMTPETFAFIEELTRWCHERNLEVLVEIHSYYRSQIEIAAQVDRVYDFALPPLILHGLIAGDAVPLLAWIEMRPTNAISVLDTHDGIGVIDVGSSPDSGEPGLLTDAQIDALVESIHRNSGGISRLATGAAASNLDLYQVNCTFFDALGGDEDAYLAARALQLFVPGIPQVYYVGLLAGSNDVDLLERTGVGRDVNRHVYDSEEIASELERPVVAALVGLIRFRNTHPAFAGRFAALGDSSTLSLQWTAGESFAHLAVDLVARVATVSYSTPDGPRRDGLWDVRDIEAV